ncbi:MAG: ABC transporter ATP-binding protein [Phycisphaeraceae bacterium]|nr:ABC transporter ATP-binding protein [Phycisphaeraceae bacterium]
MPIEKRDDPVIETVQLGKSFGGQCVLNDVSLGIQPGEIMVILGGSGCGKSTLLRTMTGLLEPDKGTVKLFGQDISNVQDDELKAIRKRFGILFQSGALFNSLTISENVALLLQEHTDLDPSTIDIMVKIKLELVGLREHADKMPAQLSGGMKKRAGLARALALDPEILFYDEPSAGLDPVTSAQIDQLIIDLTKKLNVTSVVVTHELDSGFRIADRMCMLDKGKVLKIGPRRQFETLRDSDSDELKTEDDKIIRQFLRGDADGPITKRSLTSDYADDLLMVSIKSE